MNKLFVEWAKDSFLGQLIYLLWVFVRIFISRKSFNDFFSSVEFVFSRDRISLFKTIYVNLRSFPFKTAVKMPIVVYCNVEIQSLYGTMEIQGCEVVPLMIQLGCYQRYRSKGSTRINNKGKICFHGEGKILKGAEITVFKDATLSLGNSFFVGENAIIMAAESIIIGKYCTISFDSIICDSDFHYMININDRTIRRRMRPIVIGDYNWIANNVTIKKGVKTPDHITVAGSFAVLSKDYTKEVNSFSILAGNPAVVIACGFSRVWKDEKKRIKMLNEYFKCHAELTKYELGEEEITDEYSY